ncbi:unnamed protein product [Chilo suppressalis]|uniref:Arylphorin n=1 Tax=Chilo suppressalis TaxID=168631 RepID=Q0WYG7_CHISP|nr:arylphorin [Chilo suppressalis]CAH0400857.1 unnamed protein product [Chilo suppressalis]
MRTVLVLAAVVALALAGPAPTFHKDISQINVENVDATIVEHQYKVLELLDHVNQVNTEATYYKVGKAYDIQAHVDKYEKPEVVSNFYSFYENGMVPKYYQFTIFNDNMREQAKALYDMFYYAKDFETFYKTACWARVHVNEGLFLYTFYVAVVQRADTTGVVLPAPYEIYPQFYASLETINKIYYGKIRGEPFEEYPEYGIMKEGNNHFYYQNYSDYYTYGDEYKISYLTEDIGWNAHYSYFHTVMPFWEDGDKVAHGIFKERRGEVFYYFYQQLLARYYMERLSNGMSEIPTFSWYQPFKQGYCPFLTSQITPFAQRSNNYVMQNKYSFEDLRFVRSYEDMFLSFLEQGQFTAYNKQIDFSNSKAINFVGNYWQCNPDLYEKISQRRNYYNSYEMAARRILGGAPMNFKYDEYEFVPTALDFYQTSLRDPAFYQIYNKIFHFMSQYKQYLPSYSQDDLHYVGVKVNKVEVSKLETYFDFYVYNASNAVYYQNQELISGSDKQYAIMQPRLNCNPFHITINVKSDVEEQATFKVFIGPKYDSYDNEISFEDNYMNFVELDWFSQKLSKGENVIVRKSDDFFFYKDDSISVGDIYNLLAKNQLPTDMMYNYGHLPERLMLPRGTKSGFPLQVFVAVYKSQGVPKEVAETMFFMDEKPLGYPLDRPVTKYFLQPNMYIEDVSVYHRGNEYPTSYDVVHPYVKPVSHPQ